MTHRELDELCRKLQPIFGRRIDALRLEAVGNQQNLQQTLQLLRLLADRRLGDSYHTKAILLPPPTATTAVGEYPFGTVCYGDKTLHAFGLREHEWVQHLAIFGRSGSGKTNVAFLILKQLAEHGKPFLIFDWKRNYRDLAPVLDRGHRKSGEELLVYTVGRDVAPFAFNPLIPPKGTSHSVWLKKIIDILCHVYWLGEGVAYLFQKAMDACYREARERDTWPTFMDVARWLDEYGAKGREAQWMDSARRALQALSYAETGRVFNAPRPPPLGKLLTRNVVFELDALNDNDKTFFVESLLLWVHHYRMQQGHREAFKHAILIEEAHHVLRRTDATKGGIMEVVLREIRELGEAIILLDQHPSLISLPALGNTYCTICLNLKHAKDVRTMAGAMLLNEDEAKHLGRLPVGTGIVRLQDRYSQPFVVRFPLVKLKKGAVSDKQVKRRYVRSSGSSGSSPGIRPGEDVRNSIRPARPGEDIRREEERLDEEERALVMDVIAHPTSSVTERYARLGLSADRGTKLTTQLVKRTMLQKATVTTGHGSITVLALTAKSRSAVAEEEGADSDHRRGGPEHEYWKHKIAQVLRPDGWDVALEQQTADGHYVDVVAERDGECLAVEVETGKSDVVANVRRCLEAGFDRIVVVATSREAHHIAERRLRRAGLLKPPVELVRTTDFVRRHERQPADEAA